ncbi:MAG: bifunctional 4-hydroxy-2-oxoglutarate aldolase/2-dehydro-3-deoxy-phosphogluconate aldolase [Treponema sp.]|nr:bifunctional 4-hydroxy-2-oxoglutarate aldolase/2-dehydro-3-deoxy-phosphogluconate aldolase [Treponema sp.]
MNIVFERVHSTGIVPVISLEDANLAFPLANALLKGGIDIAEITYRTDAAEQSIRNITHHCPDMLILAGTVLTVSQAQSAVNAGAKCIVSPGYDDEVVDWCISNNVAVIPGVSDATLIQKAIKKGLSVLKLFPAECLGGTKALDAFAGPFAQCMFMPTGGINADNMAQYAKKKNVIAVSGSWIATKQSISSQDWETVTRNAEQTRLSLQNR